MARSRRIRLQRGSVQRSFTKVGAGIATNYLMVFADKSMPVLAKNQFVTPLIFWFGSLAFQTTSRAGSMNEAIADGINIISGVDLVNAFVDMGKQAAAAKNAAAAGEPAAETVGRLVPAKTLNKSKNPSVRYQNMAR